MIIFSIDRVQHNPTFDKLFISLYYFCNCYHDSVIIFSMKSLYKIQHSEFNLEFNCLF